MNVVVNGDEKVDVKECGLEGSDLDELLRRHENGSLLGIYQLTSLQKGLLYDSQGEGKMGNYVTQSVYEVAANVDLESFIASWQHVCSRHDALRTTFEWADLPHPVQLVHRSAPTDVVEHDWSRLDIESSRERLEQLLIRRRANSFTLVDVPPLAFDLIRVDTNDFWVAWHVHHLVIDGPSSSLVLDELLTTYKSVIKTGRPVDLPPARQYRQHLNWLAQQDAVADADRWRTIVGDLVEPTMLLCVKRPTSNPDHTASSLVHTLPSYIYSAVVESARRRGITIHAMLQGTWALLLSSRSQNSDVCWGTIFSGRSRMDSGGDRLVGLVVNTVPARIQIDPNESASDFLHRVQKMLAQIHDLEHVGLEQIRSLTQIGGGEPLFESMFQFVPRSGVSSAGEGNFRRIRSQEQTGYPLDIAVVADESLQMHLSFELERVDDLTARRILAQFSFILEQLCAGDDKICNIDWLPHDESSLLHKWSVPEVLESSNETIPTIFDRIRLENAENPALIDSSGSRTYAEIDQLSNAIANGIQRIGVQYGEIVGISLPRTNDLVVVLLGILKAGAAYLIIDQKLPDKRRSTMIQECGVKVVVQGDETALSLSVQNQFPRLATIGRLVSGSSTQPVPTGSGHYMIDSAALAFVTYTSGTTGRPKCIGMSHRNLVRIAENPSYFASGPDRCFLQLAPVEFDASVEEIWGALLNGASVVMPGVRDLDVPDIEELLLELSVTNVSMTTGLFHLFSEVAPTAFANLDELIIGGDIARREPCNRVLELNPHLKLTNTYGPTEMTVVTTSHTVLPGESDAVPIGKPVKSTTVYLLDSFQRKVPIGIIGELYAAGAGMTYGYLNDARLTAERFLPDPFCSSSGQRMYATGDYARWNDNGELEFIGRTDRQVKIRGFRVELGEVEFRLSQHPSVAEAVVEAVNEGDAAKHLVAYVVPRIGSTFDNQELRLHLAALLPNFMVPSIFFRLDHLPLTKVGKIDRHRLPEFSGPLTKTTEDERELTHVENVLLKVWTDALGDQTLSSTSNFFEAGGDSMVSMRAAAAARRSGIVMSSGDIFRHQTILELASMLDSREATNRVDQSSIEGDVRPTPIQHWFLQHYGAENWFSQSRVLRYRGILIETAMERVLRIIVRHHDSLRLRVRRDGDNWHQWADSVDADRSFVLKTFELTPGTDVEHEAQLRDIGEALRTTIDLSSGPLLASAVVHTPKGQDDVLILVVHHWSMDLISWSLLLEDIEELYSEVDRGAAAVLPDKTSSVRAWSDSLHELADEERTRKQSERFGAPGQKISKLPRDRDIPEGTSGTNHLRVNLSEGDSRNFVRAIRSQRGVKGHELILGAAIPVFREWMEGGSVAIDVEFHGRDTSAGDLDVTRTIGWFTAIGTVLLKLDELDTFGGYLRQIRDSLPQEPDEILRAGVRRHLLTGAATDEESEVCFNYLGETRATSTHLSSFRLDNIALGPESDQGLERGYPLDINVGVDQSRLFLDIAFWQSRWRTETIESFAEEYLHQISRSIGQLSTWEMDLLHPSVWLRRLRKDSPLLTLPMQRYNVPGVSVATTIEGEVSSWTFGNVSRGGDAVDEKTRFQVGSIAKHLETIAVLRLCEDGRLSLDAPLSSVAHGPRVDSLVNIDRISVSDLLSHRSGLSSGSGNQAETIAKGSPSGAYDYDVVNFALIEEILEYTVGATIGDVVADLVLRPLGLQNTGFHPAVPDPSDPVSLAVGHSAVGREYRRKRRTNSSALDEELWATASDIARIGQDLHRSIRSDDGVLLSRNAASQLSGKVRAGYGLGTVVKQLNGLHWIGHPGDGPGFRSVYALETAGGNGIVVLANGDAATPMLEDLLVELGTDLVMRVRGSLMEWKMEESS